MCLQSFRPMSKIQSSSHHLRGRICLFAGQGVLLDPLVLLLYYWDLRGFRIKTYQARQPTRTVHFARGCNRQLIRRNSFSRRLVAPSYESVPGTARNMSSPQRIFPLLRRYPKLLEKQERPLTRCLDDQGPYKWCQFSVIHFG